jgi:XapX domain-containing protein
VTRTEWTGLAVCLLIGVIIRLLKLPIPSPPTVPGAFMVVATTVGFVATDFFLRRPR